MIKLTLPLPISVNNYWGQSGHRKFIKKTGVEFRRKVQEAVIEAGARIEGRIAIFVSIYPKTKRRQDIDNFLKSLCDSLQLAGAFDDDEQIDCLWVIRKEIVKGGMCKVVIVPADDKLFKVYEEISHP